MAQPKSGSFFPCNEETCRQLVQSQGSLWQRHSLVAQMVKNLSAMQETQVRPLGWEYPLKKGMTTHSSILVWRSLWKRNLASYIQSMGLPRVGHDWAANTFTCFFHFKTKAVVFCRGRQSVKFTVSLEEGRKAKIKRTGLLQQENKLFSQKSQPLDFCL